MVHFKELTVKSENPKWRIFNTNVGCSRKCWGGHRHTTGIVAMHRWVNTGKLQHCKVSTASEKPKWQKFNTNGRCSRKCWGGSAHHCHESTATMWYYNTGMCTLYTYHWTVYNVHGALQSTFQWSEWQWMHKSAIVTEHFFPTESTHLLSEFVIKDRKEVIFIFDFKLHFCTTVLWVELYWTQVLEFVTPLCSCRCWKPILKVDKVDFSFGLWLPGGRLVG